MPFIRDVSANYHGDRPSECYARRYTCMVHIGTYIALCLYRDSGLCPEDRDILELHCTYYPYFGKVLGVQLILAYNWARPAILVVGKGRGGMFLFLLFLHFLSCSSFFPVPLFHLLYSLFYLFSPFLWETTQNDPQGLTCR